MLSRPQHGWTDFSLGNSVYCLSYLTDIPLDWLERAIFGLQTFQPFEVYGYCEPGRLVCAVDLLECRIYFDEDKHIKNDGCIKDCPCEVVPINMLEFCKVLHRDISEYIVDWEKWHSSSDHGREDIRFRLERLEKLIDVKGNCFA